MNTKDILLAAALDFNTLSSSKSFINSCCVHNLDFARTYDRNTYDNRAIPSKHVAIICCMDARLDIYRMLGLQPGEAHIIRNGGGRIRDAVRSLICSQKLFQTSEVQTGTKTTNLPRSQPLYEGNKPDFMPMMDVEQSIRDDIAEYKQYPLLNQDVIVRGFVYDTKTGLLKEIQ